MEFKNPLNLEISIKFEEDKEKEFLSSLGFTGLRKQYDHEDVLSFFYNEAPEKLGEVLSVQPRISGKEKHYFLKDKGIVIITNSVFGSVTIIHNPIVYRFVKDETKHIHLSNELTILYERSKLQPDSQKLIFMSKLWDFLNKTKFQGRLGPKPEFALSKDLGEKSRNKGMWYPGLRKLRMSKTCFHASQDVFVNVFLHEMCHEAVTDIDKREEEENKGHGPRWAAYMESVGLSPDRYVMDDRVEFLTGKNKKMVEEYRKDLSKGVTDQNGFRFSHFIKKFAERTFVFMKRGETYKPVFIVSKAKSNNWFALKPEHLYNNKFFYLKDSEILYEGSLTIGNTILNHSGDAFYYEAMQINSVSFEETRKNLYAKIDKINTLKYKVD